MRRMRKDYILWVKYTHVQCKKQNAIEVTSCTTCTCESCKSIEKEIDVYHSKSSSQRDTCLMYRTTKARQLLPLDWYWYELGNTSWIMALLLTVPNCQALQVSGQWILNVTMTFKSCNIIMLLPDISARCRQELRALVSHVTSWLMGLMTCYHRLYSFYERKKANLPCNIFITISSRQLVIFDKIVLSAFVRG